MVAGCSIETYTIILSCRGKQKYPLCKGHAKGHSLVIFCTLHHSNCPSEKPSDHKSLLVSQVPPKQKRFLSVIAQQLPVSKPDARLPGLERLARPTQRFTTRAKKGSEPFKAVMRDEQITFDSKANGTKLYNAHEQANVARADYHRELPSLSDQAKERHAAVPSSSQPSSGRARNTQTDASKGVPVFVMLPLDTVSFSKT